MTNTNSSHDLFWLDEKRAVQWAALKKWLPDLKTALFFAKAYKLPVEKLSDLVFTLFNTPLFDELKTGVHSTDLQDYLVELFPDVIHIQEDVTFSTEEAAPDDAFLQLIENAAVEIATSIQEVADSLGKVLHGLPGKSGEMVFENLAKLNVQRMSLGKFSAGIRHKPVAKTLVIFDVSGSMTKNTVTKIADAVVSMSYEVNASLAIVSYDTFVWNAGRFSTQEVLPDGSRPDAVVRLPGGRAIPIDAKVPFDSYLQSTGIEGDDPESVARRRALEVAHAKALRAHVDALAARDYHGRIGTAEVTVMFVPSEGLLAAARQAHIKITHFQPLTQGGQEHGLVIDDQQLDPVGLHFGHGANLQF